MKRLGNSSQKGAVLVFFALLLPVIVFFAGMAIDFGRAYMHKSYLQNAADAAALAGASAVAGGKGARLVDDIPSGFLNINDTGMLIVAGEAANKILLKDTGKASANDTNTKLRSNIAGEAVTFYYMVELTEDVKMVFAQFFLPKSLFPNDWTVEVSARAWARSSRSEEGDGGEDVVGGDPYGRTQLEQMQEVADRETTTEFFAWKKTVGNDMTTAQQLSFTNAGVRYNNDGTRSEVFDMKLTESNNRKDLFINFKQDLQYNNKLMENWDAVDLRGLSYEEAKAKFNALGLKLASVVLPWGDGSIPISKLTWNEEEHAYVAGNNNLSWDDFETAYKKLHNGVLNKDEILNYITSTISGTINLNSAYPVRDLSTLSPKEKSLTIRGNTNKQDPLYVRIESEEFNAGHVANTIRDIRININAENTEKDGEGKSRYRPVLFFYDGPIDVNNERGVGRQSNTVVVTLNKDFRGIIYAPNSPVQVIGNGHAFSGFIIASRILGKNEFGEDVDLTNMMPEHQNEETDPVLQDFYSKLGLGDAKYNDFDAIGLNVYRSPKKDVVYLTSRSGKTR